MALTTATTTGGAVRGYPGRNQKVSVFKGIPFATAHRWRRPVPVAWEGELDASHFTTVCPQRVFKPEGGTELAAAEFYAHDYPMGEDCLVANVWTPAATADEALPVAVYIHGGAFETGYGWLNAYDGEGFGRRGVVLVTLNYRLNVFGFLALPELAAEDPDGATGNYGLLDQLAGLAWVRDNIASFGGDPGRVTVFGQSAGGMSVADLLNSPLSAGLIHGAIMQSGGGLTYRSVGEPLALSDAFAAGRAFLADAGCRTLDDARALSASDLLDRYVAFSATRPMPFQPVVDGYVIPERPVDYFGSGKHADIPTMVGATADEMRNLSAPPPTKEQVDALAARLGDQAAEFAAAVDAAGGRQRVRSLRPHRCRLPGGRVGVVRQPGTPGTPHLALPLRLRAADGGHGPSLGGAPLRVRDTQRLGTALSGGRLRPSARSGGVLDQLRRHREPQRAEVPERRRRAASGVGALLGSRTRCRARDRLSARDGAGADDHC